MSQLRFLGSGSCKGSARVSIDLPIMRTIYLMLVIKGTTDTAQTLDEADVGRIRIQRGGRQIIGETFEFFFDLSNLMGGYPHKTAPTAGASRLVAMIPFYLLGARNALDVRSKEEVDVYLDFNATLDTRFGANAGTYELYARNAEGIPEQYEIQIEEQDIVASGSGRYEDILDGRNLAQAYLRDASSVVDKVQLHVDGSVVVDNIDDAAILDVTTFEQQVEAAAGGLILVNNMPGGNIAEASNSNSELDVDFSGAGTLEVTKVRWEPSRRAEQSVADVRALLAGRVTGAGLRQPRSLPAGARG